MPWGLYWWAKKRPDDEQCGITSEGEQYVWCTSLSSRCYTASQLPLMPKVLCPGARKCCRGVFERTSRDERDPGLGQACVVESMPEWGFAGQPTPSAAVQTCGFGGRGLVECHEAAEKELEGFAYCSFKDAESGEDVSECTAPLKAADGGRYTAGWAVLGFGSPVF